MRKQLIALFALSSMWVSGAVFAHSISEDMDILAKNYNTVLSTKEVSELKRSLHNMREAALNAQNLTPPKLADEAPDSASMKEYRHGYDLLVNQIDSALTLANAGKVKEAQTVAEAFNVTRTTYHKKFR